MSAYKKNQEELRKRLNAIQDEYGELYFELNENSAKLMDWIILMHMDIQRLKMLLEDFFQVYIGEDKLMY